jgi:hypothetical protein
VIDGIDAYLYHMGDEFSKALDFHQADRVHVHTHGRLFTSHASCLWNSKWEWDKEILYIIYK